MSTPKLGVLSHLRSNAGLSAVEPSRAVRHNSARLLNGVRAEIRRRERDGAVDVFAQPFSANKVGRDTFIGSRDARRALPALAKRLETLGFKVQPVNSEGQSINLAHRIWYSLGIAPAEPSSDGGT